MTRKQSRSRGQTLVEVALVLPLLVVLIAGIFDFGRAIYGYNTVLNSSREAARLAIVDQSASAVEQKAIDHSVGLGLEASDVDLDFRTVTNLNTPGSCNSKLGTPEIVGCVAVVRVQYSYEASVPVITALVGPIILTGETRFPVEHNAP